MSIKPWKVLETSYLHPMFRIDKCELSDGHLLDATIFEFRAWANVVALTGNDEVVLVKQYRHGVCEAIFEFPGGIVEAEEDPAEGVKRELLEETGYKASNLIQVGQIYPNSALQTNTLHCFLALNAEKVGEQNLDAGEDIEVRLMPPDELIEMVKRGEFPDALQIAVLFQVLAYMGRIH